MSITVDKEFEALIPPLSPDEFQQLEENCVNEGIRDALITWNDILIDGHNRFRIAAKHGLKWTEKQMDFANREDAVRWIILNQFGRRNLSAYDRSVLALKLKPIIAEKAKERMVNAPQKKAEREKEINKIWQEHDFETARILVAQKKQEFGREDRTSKMAGEKCIYFARFGDNLLKIGSSVYPEDRVNQKSDKSIDTKKELAKAAGVSHDTIHKVETIQNSGDQKLINDVRSGETTINRAYQVVKGIDPIKTKSPAQMHKERIDKAQEEREQFKEKKVVTLEDIKADKVNRRTLARDQYMKLLNMGKRIEEIGIQIQEGDFDIYTMAKELSFEERKTLLDLIGFWRKELSLIAQTMVNGKQ